MTIPHAVLALLDAEPKFGLRLKEEFEARTGFVWPLNVGQVYTTLQRLERDGLVTAAGLDGESPSQKLYTLTNDGRKELFEWFRTPPESSVPPRDEVVIKVMVALTVRNVDVFSILQTHRVRLIEAMQSFTRLKRDALDDLALTLVADAELFRLEASVRWIDSCEARLRRGDSLSPTEIDRPRMNDHQTTNKQTTNKQKTDKQKTNEQKTNEQIDDRSSASRSPSSVKSRKAKV
jgi:DNA-binding PadR family transcriptional regulator